MPYVGGSLTLTQAPCSLTVYQFSPLNAAHPSTPRPTSNSARSLKFDISSTTKDFQAALCFPALSDSIDYVQTTKEYRGDDTTLRRRHQRKQVSGHKATFESKYLLTDAPEQASFTYKETFRASDSSTPQMARNCGVENEKKAGERAGFMRWSNALARSLILLLLLTRFPPNLSANAWPITLLQRGCLQREHLQPGTAPTSAAVAVPRLPTIVLKPHWFRLDRRPVVVPSIGTPRMICMTVLSPIPHVQGLPVTPVCRGIG